LSLHINDAVIWQEAGAGISLYHTETGEFRTLNETAAKIWSLVESDGERAPVVWKMALQFGGTNAALSGRIRTEVDAFISSLVDGGLLTESLSV
jgi:hypothetical protein